LNIKTKKEKAKGASKKRGAYVMSKGQLKENGKNKYMG